ncbi:MAG TPA: hypothetical protein VJ860_07045 [Polyangia bacterium]|nr:hypothetical protein [Polyangia bacterium]
MNGWPPNFLCASAVLALATLGNARPIRADQAGALTFSWQAPAGCPSRGQVSGEIARLLGGEIRVPQGGDITARAVVEHGPTWSLAMDTELAGRPGRRSLEAASCQDLANAAALIVALMIDPDAVAAHATTTQPVAAPAPPLTAPPATDPAPESRPRSVEFLVGVHAAGSYGTLPSVDVGAGGGIGLQGRRWRAEVRGTYGLRRDQKAMAAAPAGAYGQFNFTAVAFAGCLNLGRGGLAFGPCADAEFGVTSAQGFGVSQSLPASTPWLAVGAGGYAAISLGRHLSLPLHLDVLAPLRRSEFVFKNEPKRVFQAPAVGVRMSAGIELHF